MTSKAERLRRLLADRVRASKATGILFSGGLDTSILAAVAAEHGCRLKAVMVSVADGAGLDEPFAEFMAQRLGLELVVLRPTLSELWSRMPELITILKSFDPMELRNSIAAYTALEAAAQMGNTTVMTGDAADELFAGYTFMFTMPPEQLAPYRAHINDIMHFSTPLIGDSFGLEVEVPYLADALRNFAMSLPVSDLVGIHEGQRCGKLVLRQAFSVLLPAEIVWRTKTPMEYGSGTTALRRFAEDLVSEDEFADDRRRIARDDSVQLRDREQYAYYRIFRNQFRSPREMQQSVKTCAECRGPLPSMKLTYCRICGAYPV
jgi:asparagine synthase (glutamine-hydrolysing)